MDSDLNRTISSAAASILIVFRRAVLLIFTPYTTMRKISLETDFSQVYVILALVLVYFLFSGIEKLPVFLLNFSITLLIFKLLGKVFNKDFRESSLVFTLTYSLIPTLIWFVFTYIMYLFLPPPRGFTTLGKAFSIFYICFSLSILLWKIILEYLTLRFSVKKGFYSIMYILLIYIVYLWNFSVIMYRFGLSKVPFI